MKAELKVGQAGWVKVRVNTVTEMGPEDVTVTLYDDPAWTVRVGPANFIPIPEPLPAPNCAGPWANVVDGVLYARQVYKDADTGKFYYWDGCITREQTAFTGSWHAPIDPRLVGVEVEEERKPEPEPKDQHDIAMKFIDDCVVAFSAACDNLIERIEPTPAPPGDET